MLFLIILVLTQRYIFMRHKIKLTKSNNDFVLYSKNRKLMKIIFKYTYKYKAVSNVGINYLYIIIVEYFIYLPRS